MYVDGNTGSMIVQAAVAGAAGVGVAGAAVWRKMSGPMRRGKKGAPTEASQNDTFTEQK